jgi:hypothetical protein
VEETSGYVTPSEFCGLGLKTIGDRFTGFWPQNLGEDLGSYVACHRRACVETKHLHEGLMADARNPIWTISFPWISGLRQIPRSNRRMCNSPINKDSGYLTQPSLPLKPFP